MKLTLTYELERDVENLLKSLKSVNSLERTDLEKEYLAQYAEASEEDAEKFLSAKNFDSSAALGRLKTSWEPIEDRMIERMEEMFGITITLPHGYLTSNSRCTYNTASNYFFVNMFGQTTNRNIAHELLHFYTWHAFHNELEAKGVTKEEYNDIKESLTELLNTDFQDLLSGQIDYGYPQHTEMRKRVREMRGQSRSVSEIVSQFIPETRA